MELTLRTGTYNSKIYIVEYNEGLLKIYDKENNNYYMIGEDVAIFSYHQYYCTLNDKYLIVNEDSSLTLTKRKNSNIFY